MKQIVTIILAALLFAACGNKEQQLQERAAELCRYIPDHQLNPEAKSFMTTDFYAVLDTMFNHLLEEEDMDIEWLYYFVTGNGGTFCWCHWRVEARPENLRKTMMLYNVNKKEFVYKNNVKSYKFSSLCAFFL